MKKTEFSKETVIAVDLGGTNLRVGAVSAKGEVLAVEKIPTLSKEKKEIGLEQIALGIDSLIQKNSLGRPYALALGIPGIVEQKTGVVYCSPHFPDWKSVEARSYFEKRFSCPVVVDNDAHMIARGEGWKGTGKGLEHFILVTLGTGIGGALVCNRSIFHGDSGFAAEIGHMVIESEGRPCNCGSHGCWEMYASATGLLYGIEHDKVKNKERDKLLERFGGLLKVTVARLYESVQEGDLYAHAVFQKLGYHLGIGIASLVNITGIETVILAGGVSRAWDFFVGPMKKETALRTYKETASRIQIKQSTLGDEAGLIGGSAAFFQNFQHHRQEDKG
ncbi:MAG: ROK family protein [Deltaproteobacteria bacterium]|nr:ROK family protein [Deltaproteobacteria bacterium]